MTDAAAATSAERAARLAHGRLLAILAARSRDIAGAQRVLADALARALDRSPHDGVPERPESWLLAVARNRRLDAWRHTRGQDDAAQALLLLAGEMDVFAEAGGEAIPDDRLRLFFACTHPGIDAAARTPLLLQTLLGRDAAHMAATLLTSPATLSQRMARAKSHIRQSRHCFELPAPRELTPRLLGVLDAIHAAYGSGWDDVDGADARPHGLSADAVELARLLCTLMPDEPEPLGLLALMLFGESRADARRSDAGAYLPLDRQDPSRWNPDLLAEAEACLRRASAMGRPGPYQLEAAIQSAHCERRVGAPVPPETLVSLYQRLLALRPSIGAQVSLACALGNARGPDAGLRILDAIPPDEVADYQPFWAARAHLLRMGGARAASRQACERAIVLASSAAVRTYLGAMIATG